MSAAGTPVGGARLGHAQFMDQLVLFDPISATGGVILTKLIYEMKRGKSRYDLATMCLGGGQGAALIIRNNGGHLRVRRGCVPVEVLRPFG